MKLFLDDDGRAVVVLSSSWDGYIRRGGRMLCSECGNEMRVTSEPMRETYRGHDFEVTGIERWACDRCGNDEMSGEMADRWGAATARERARIDGLLTPEEIRGARRRSGLTQAQLERALGVSSPTVSRCETGAMLPSRTACKLMRVFDEEPGARRMLLDMAEDGAPSPGEWPRGGVGASPAGVTGHVQATPAPDPQATGKAGQGKRMP